MDDNYEITIRGADGEALLTITVVGVEHKAARRLVDEDVTIEVHRLRETRDKLTRQTGDVDVDVDVEARKADLAASVRRFEPR